MKSRPLIALLFAVCCSLTVGAADERPRNLDRSLNPTLRRGPLEGTGVVRYDPGAPADDFYRNGPSYDAGYYGNVFATQNGQNLSSGTITGVSWYQGALGLYDDALVVFGRAYGTMSTGITVLDPQPYAFNAVSVSVPFEIPKFVGLALGFDAFGSVGGRSATTNGQGFHGRQRAWYNTNGNPVTGVNLMVRISGNMVIPVELIEFEVASEVEPER